jgi:hypothetical protein
MRHLKQDLARFALTLSLATAVAVGASPVFADPLTATATITGGSLSMVATDPPSFTVSLGSVTTPATDTIAIDVKDLRGSGAGWNLQITSTQFSAGSGNVLPTNATSITLVTAACDAGVCTPAVNTVVTPVTVPADTTAPDPVKFFSTQALTGMGDFTVTPTFSLSVPANTLAGTYTSTMTITSGAAP